LLYENIGIQAK